MPPLELGDRDAMTARIREFLKQRRDSGTDEGPCLVVDLDVVRTNYQNFAKALPDTRVFYAVKANPAPEVLAAAGQARLVLRHRLGRRDRDGARGRRHRPTASPTATPSRRSATSRAPTRSACGSMRSTARPRSRRSPAPPPAPSVFCRILSDCVGAEWPLSRKFGCEPAMAADVLEHAHKLGLEAHGVSFHVGSQQTNQHAWDRALGLGRRRVPRVRRARHQPVDGQPRRRLPDPLPEERADGESLRLGDLPRAAQALRQPHPGDHHRAGPRHGRQCRRHRGRGRAGLQEEQRGRRALGLSRPRQVRRPGRDDGRVDPLSDPHAAGRRRRWDPACSPARPATRWTCCTRSSPTSCR